MSRLPVLSGKACVKALEKIGFVVKRQRGSHIRMHRAEPFAIVVVPNHKTLKKGLLRQIINDADLTVNEFRKLL